ncbi:MAG TPA: metal-dependent hydrolase [Holophagaceae bacterium]|nr:metal-dependent hydrolase [Holophagaceae bacterium]
MRTHTALAALLAAPALVAAAPQAKKVAPKTQPITVTWLGHAAFEVVSSGGTRLLLDPFLTQDPATPAAFKDLSRYKPDAILVTHSHFDHTGDVAAIAKQSGAPVIGAYELAASLGLPEKQVMGGNVGGTFQIGDITIHMVPAMHSSEPGGRPVGFVLTFKDGRSLYHTGDTWIFGDMSLIQELYHPSILLLGVGGGPYTEDPATAALAVKKYFHPSVIVPMHYGTFPGLATDAQVRAAFKGDKRLTVMKPGQTLTF